MTIWSLIRQHILSKKLIVIVFCLLFTSGITFIRPLVIKGITDEGMLKANMTMIVIFALFLFVCVDRADCQCHTEQTVRCDPKLNDAFAVSGRI